MSVAFASDPVMTLSVIGFWRSSEHGFFLIAACRKKDQKALGVLQKNAIVFWIAGTFVSSVCIIILT